MTISSAIDKIYYSTTEEYEFYLFCLWNNELVEEEEELKEAYEVLSEAGISYTAEITNKKSLREKNVVPKPILFIDRPHFFAVETDELPF